jgi:hypothetical protein
MTFLETIKITNYQWFRVPGSGFRVGGLVKKHLIILKG